MANKKTRAIDKDEFNLIIDNIRKGFILGNKLIRPNTRIATALTLEANLGLRIGDIVKLRLSDILFEGGRYHLNIVEEKTKKVRNFTVPNEIYTYMQTYALENNIKPNQRLFDMTVRAIQIHLQNVCTYLNLTNISTHSFRKFFAMSIYNSNDYNVELVRQLLQHSSVAITQHYLSVDSKLVEDALSKHVVLPI